MWPLKTKVLRAFEPAEFTHSTTRRHIPENLNPQFHRSKKNPEFSSLLISQLRLYVLYSSEHF
jgi:hypothetical protein